MNKQTDNNTSQSLVGRTLPNAAYVTPSNAAVIDASPWRRLLKRTVIILLILALAAGAYGAYAWRSAQQALGGGSLFSMLTSDEPLTKDANNRTNIVVFGNSEDDPGHDGAKLADSIMVISVNQDTHATSMVSIPRDLYVQYNSDCSLGSSGKINASYVCALQANNNNVPAASEAFSQQVASVVGLDIHYYVKIDYTVIKQTVDTLGDVTVTINSKDSRGIYDAATGLRLSNGTHTLDGTTALQFARARGSKGGYGFEQSNFNREQNQQLLAKAILEKASSAGTLSNPVKVIALVNSMGDNIRTNLTAGQIRSAVSLAKNVQSNAIASIPLNSTTNPLVTTGTYNGQSIVRPVAGLYDYSSIHAAIAAALV